MTTPLCICTRLRRATREVSKRYDAALAAAGMNVAQFSLLRAIERAGETSIGELAQETQLDASTLGRNVRVLERAGFIILGPGADKRTRLIRLAPFGHARLAEAARLWRDAQQDMERKLGSDGRNELFAMLDLLEAA